VQGGITILENRCTILQILEIGDARTSEEVTMDWMNHPQVEREARMAQASREELVERIARAVREDGTVKPLEGLHLNRSSSPTEPKHGVSKPTFCVIA
jgi:hypothetical protein